MTLNTWIAAVAALGCLLLSVTVAVREKRQLVPLLMTLGLAVLGIEQGAVAWFSFQSSPMPQNVILVSVFLPGIWMAFSLSFGRANYKEFLDRWKWVLGLAFFVPLLIAFLPIGGFIQPVLRIDPSEKIFLLGIRGFLYYLVLILLSTLILTNLEKTLRSSIGRIRWQIKFTVLGLGALFATRIYTSSEALLFSSWSEHLDRINAYGILAFLVLNTISLRRSRTLAFDLYISTAALRSSVTVLAVGAYLVGVGLVVQVLRILKWETDFEEVVIFLAAVFLLLALLSDRVRQSTRLFIQRHLKRPTYDYRMVWNQFNQAVVNKLNEAEVGRAVVAIAAKYLECLSVTLYIRNPVGKGYSVLASTSKERSRELIIAEDVEQSKDLFVQLKTKNEILGFLRVGERVRGKKFSFEDQELLEVLADQTTAILMNIRLSRQLQETSEIEAFQTMSAFFIHDLKNLANRLSLTVQNLPKHYDKPEFREEAFRTISLSVEKIKGMCTQLSSLREKLELVLIPADLTMVVKVRLQRLMTQVGDLLDVDLNGHLPVQLDEGQFTKVLDNLILNAKESFVEETVHFKNKPRIRIRTFRQDKFAVLDVSDNGCGMSREFVEDRLFHPFQTTKKQGMGIGLYQSKMIIEKHGGRIEVESKEESGTTFRVFLPEMKDQS
jgi:signal transduction histidine kinase